MLYAILNPSVEDFDDEDEEADEIELPDEVVQFEIIFKFNSQFWDNS